MGASDASDLGKMERDPDWDTPQFAYCDYSERFVEVPPRCGWANAGLMDRVELRASRDLIMKLNDMQRNGNAEEAMKLAQASKWFCEMPIQK